jgi:hypothetical protein
MLDMQRLLGMQRAQIGSGVRREQRQRLSKESNSAGWFAWEADDMMLIKHWNDLFFRRLQLNERQFDRLNEFLDYYGLIDASDDLIIKIRRPFAFARDEDTMFIQLVNLDDNEEEYVRYAIKIKH